MDANLYKNVTI